MRQGKSRADTLRQVASKLRLDATSDVEVRGVVDGFEVFVRYEISAGEAAPESRVGVKLGDDPVWKSFSLKRADAWMRYKWPFKMAFITFDDPGWDEAFAVRGRDSEGIRLRLDSRRRARIARRPNGSQTGRSRTEWWCDRWPA